MRPRTQTISRLDYCQYLLVSQINYTLTNFAEHSEKFSHDAPNRYLDGDGKTKLDHVQDMLLNCIHQKQLQFWAVLMDSWYATKEIIVAIEKYRKIIYCPLKDNRQVDDSGGSQSYRRVDGLEWTEAEKLHGKVIKIKGFPGNHKVKLFRAVLSAFGEAHGLCRNQRHGARRHAGCTRGVQLLLESRAVSP